MNDKNVIKCNESQEVRHIQQMQFSFVAAQRQHQQQVGKKRSTLLVLIKMCARQIPVQPLQTYNMNVCDEWAAATAAAAAAKKNLNRLVN